MRSEIAYARNGGVAIAYQVVGDADTDLVYVPDFVSNLVFTWESSYWQRFVERLSRSFRVILFDKRGTGISDHGTRFAALETRMEDLGAVLEAVDASRAVVLGALEGCGMAALFAATYPERVRALALFHPVARGPGTDDAELQAELSALREGWGTRDWSEGLLREICPTLYADEGYRRWFPDSLRVGASPEVAYALNRAHFETDLRDVYPAVRVPTLVLYRHGAPFEAEDDALQTAALIPNARTMRVSGTDYYPLLLSLDAVDEIERLVAGEEPPTVPTSVLTTVMFTDLVGSTERASAVGDRAWSVLLQEHHALVRREIARFRGDERDTAGDGFFVTFDGPARAIRAAQSILTGLVGLGLDARVGIHVGECEVHDGKPTGIAVNIGARVAALGGAGDVLVTRTVRDLVAGSDLVFGDRGRHRLKGVQGEWEVFAVASEADRRP